MARLAGVSQASSRPEDGSSQAPPPDQGGEPDEDEDEFKTGQEGILHLLRECGLWWSVNGKRPGHAWAFMVPTDAGVLKMGSDGLTLPKVHGVCCWLCHFETHGELPANYPISLGTEESEERRVDEAAAILGKERTLQEIDRRAVMNLSYKQQSSSTNLRHHAAKYHRTWYNLLVKGDEDDNGGEAGDLDGSEATQVKKRGSSRGLYFKPLKKMKEGDVRQKLFVKLLTYVIVFLRWSFSVLDNPWFRAFVWFLDGTVIIPARKQWQMTHLPAAVKAAHSSVMSSLKSVKGVSVMFDLWMSRAGEELE